MTFSRTWLFSAFIFEESTCKHSFIHSFLGMGWARVVPRLGLDSSEIVEPKPWLVSNNRAWACDLLQMSNPRILPVKMYTAKMRLCHIAILFSPFRTILGVHYHNPFEFYFEVEFCSITKKRKFWNVIFR